MADLMAVSKLPVCQLCRYELASGVFRAEFSSQEELVLLCSQCGFYTAWAKWHGHMTKKLKSLTLLALLIRQGDEAQLKPVANPIPLAPTFEWSEYRAIFDGGDLFDQFTVDIGGFSTEWAALERARQISQQLASTLRDKGELVENHWNINTAVARVTSAINALPSLEEKVYEAPQV